MQRVIKKIFKNIVLKLWPDKVEKTFCERKRREEKERKGATGDYQKTSARKQGSLKT